MYIIFSFASSVGVNSYKERVWKGVVFGGSKHKEKQLFPFAKMAEKHEAVPIFLLEGIAHNGDFIFERKAEKFLFRVKHIALSRSLSIPH